MKLFSIKNLLFFSFICFSSLQCLYAMEVENKIDAERRMVEFLIAIINHLPEEIQQYNCARVTLNEAASRNNTIIAKKFITVLKDRFTTYSFDYSCRLAFFTAAARNNCELLKAFYDNQMNFNIRDAFGRTALINAVVTGNEDAVAFLLEHHADPQIISMDYKTALIEAIHKDKEAIAKLLLTHNACPNGVGYFYDSYQFSTLLGWVAHNKKFLKYIPLLLEAGANINGVGNNKLTPLIYSIAFGNLSASKLLLENNANPCLKGKFDIPRKIVDCGNLKNKNVTALDVALKKKSRAKKQEEVKYEAIITLLHSKMLINQPDPSPNKKLKGKKDK